MRAKYILGCLLGAGIINIAVAACGNAFTADSGAGGTVATGGATGGASGDAGNGGMARLMDAMADAIADAFSDASDAQAAPPQVVTAKCDTSFVSPDNPNQTQWRAEAKFSGKSIAELALVNAVVRFTPESLNYTWSPGYERQTFDVRIKEEYVSIHCGSSPKGEPPNGNWFAEVIFVLPAS